METENDAQQTPPSRDQRPAVRAIRLPRIPRSLFLLAILVGPVIGLAVHWLAVRAEHDRARAQLEGRVATAAFAIDRELAADIEALFALRSHFDSGPAVTREKFASMARSFLGRHPSLQALEWIPVVGLEKRQAHEERVRNEGFTGYTITEWASPRELVPANERDWYYPVTFLEPFEGNEQAFGFDLGSNWLRREAMERAAASGNPTLTDPIDLVQSEGIAKGVLALLAVSPDGFGNTEAHRPSLSGFVVAVFDIARLLQHAQLGPGSPALSGIHIELVDDDVDGRNLLIYRSPLESQQRPVGRFSAQQLIDIGGQRWRLVAHATPAFLQPLRTQQPVLLGAIAAFTWALLVGLIAILTKRTTDRLERRHTHLMHNVLGSLTDGVIVADTTGKILMANRAAIAIAGRGETNIPPSEWSEALGLFVPGTEELFPPDELPLARAIRGEATNSVEVLVRNSHVPNGAHVSASGAPIKSRTGSLRGGVVVFRDISERKRAEERLQRLSSAIEHTADSVLITDQQGTIEYVNPAFESTTGYSSAEALGKNPKILKSGVQNPQFYRDLWTTVLRGETFRGMTVNRKKDGGFYHAEQTITPMKDGDGQITHFVSVLKDMTERRKIQEQEIEIQLASMVQKRLFPSAPPQLIGYDLAGAVFPAEATCGDYFDFITMSNGAMVLVAADVSGHGLGPALVMAETRAYLRSLMQWTNDLAAIASDVNRFLVADLQENFFVTMLLVKLEPGTGRLAYVNSAHPSGYIIDASGKVSAELTSRCLPLGLFLDRWRCDIHELVVNPGELVVLVTDGVLETEAPDGEEFGTGRFLEVVSRHRRGRAQEIVEHVHRSVQDYGQDQTQMDDVTIVVCKRESVD